jgi:hypothetical protein
MADSKNLKKTTQKSTNTGGKKIVRHTNNEETAQKRNTKNSAIFTHT